MVGEKSEKSKSSFTNDETEKLASLAYERDKQSYHRRQSVSIEEVNNISDNLTKMLEKKGPDLSKKSRIPENIQSLAFGGTDLNIIDEDEQYSSSSDGQTSSEEGKESNEVNDFES